MKIRCSKCGETELPLYDCNECITTICAGCAIIFKDSAWCDDCYTKEFDKGIEKIKEIEND